MRAREENDQSSWSWSYHLGWLSSTLEILNSTTCIYSGPALWKIQKRWKPGIFFLRGNLSPTPLFAGCLLKCSGHGHCDPLTKRCICSQLWMENLIQRYIRDGESNCGEFWCTGSFGWGASQQLILR
jgi:hypothetical protein